MGEMLTDPSIYESKESQPGNFAQQQVEMNQIQGEQVPGAPLPRELAREQQQDINSIAETQEEMRDQQAKMQEMQKEELKAIEEIRDQIVRMSEDK